jgi:tetratricopeptide (TPR) repeat protein
MNFKYIFSKYYPENRWKFLKVWLLVMVAVCLLTSCGGGGEEKEGPDRSKMEDAKLAFDEENYDKAKSAVEYFLAQHPEDVEALYFYAQVLVQTGQLLKARERANELLAIDATLAEPKAILGDVHYRRREFPEALNLSRQVTRPPKSSPNVKLIKTIW